MCRCVCKCVCVGVCVHVCEWRVWLVVSVYDGGG